MLSEPVADWPRPADEARGAGFSGQGHTAVTELDRRCRRQPDDSQDCTQAGIQIGWGNWSNSRVVAAAERGIRQLPSDYRDGRPSFDLYRRFNWWWLFKSADGRRSPLTRKTDKPNISMSI